MSRTLRKLLVVLVLAGAALWTRWTATDGLPSSRSGGVDGAFEAHCVKVHDGDTLTVERDSGRDRLRLFGVDAPEKGQAFSEVSRRRTRELAEGRWLLVIPRDEDRYGRLVASIEVEGRDLGLQLLEEGLVWHYRRYSDDRSYSDAEEQAREAGRGLWAEKSPKPPWVYRQERR